MSLYASDMTRSYVEFVTHSYVEFMIHSCGVRDSRICGVRESCICEVHDPFIRDMQTIGPMCMDINVHMSAMQVGFVTPSDMEFVTYSHVRSMTHLYVECRLLCLYVWIWMYICQQCKCGS